MNEYLQFALMYVCRETERTNEEFGFVIPNPLFGFEYNKSSPVTGLEWPTGFQEVTVPRFHDSGTGR
jgi:hypothetical protein